ncbi:PAS domain S-box-containing protein [Actinoplanes tereljensis]|nr:PAS domain S-box protein [Actinoplanes tereljensis]
MLDRLTLLATRLLGTPVALVSLVDDSRQFFASSVGLPEPAASRRETPLPFSFCRHVVVSESPLIVTDARYDHRVRENPAVKALGMVAYAGFPLRTPEGQTLGSFCVIDTRPREWSADELAMIEDLASAVEAEIAVRLSHADLLVETRRIQMIVDAAADAFVTADEAGLVRTWNNAAERLFGWPEVDALGRPLTDLIVPERFRAQHEAGLERVRRAGASQLAGQRLDMIAVDRAGREFPVEMTLQAQVEGGTTMFHAFLHDITDRQAHVQALADSESRFRSLFESSPIGMALVGLDGAWLRVNPAIAAITGYTMPELMAIDFQTITHPEDLEADLAQVDRLIAGDINDYRMHKRYLRKDGRAVWCQLSVTLMRDEDGRPLHFLSQIVEVDAERRSQELLDVTFSSSPDLHLLTTPDGTIVRSNAAWEKVLGWTGDELRGTDLSSLIHPDDRPANPVKGNPVGTTRCRGKAGQYRWLQWTGAALPGQGLSIASARDITEARTVEEALRRSEEQSRAAFEASPLGMVITDEQGRSEQVNAAFATMLGISVEDLVGRDYRDLVHPDDLEVSDRETARIGQGPSATAALRKRFVRADSTVAWAQVTMTAITDPDGQPQRLIQIEDITARKSAEALAARETDRLRTTIAAQREVAAAASDRGATLALVAERTLAALPAAEGAVVALIDGAGLQAQAAAGTLAEMTGRQVACDGSLAGLAIRTRTTLRSDDTAADERVDRAACQAGSIGSMIIAPLFADGTAIGTLGVTSRQPNTFDDADTQQLTLLADALSGALQHAEAAEYRVQLLQQANQAVAALEASEARFRSAFDNCPLGMVLTSMRTDSLGVVLQANEAMAAITGYPVSELAGMPVHEFHHPDDRAETDRALAAVLRMETDTFTTAKRYRHADGHTVWVRLHVAVVRDDARRPLYLVTQVEDVTARREIDEQLRQRAQLLDLTQDAVIVRDLGGHITYWNPAAERIYGWAADVAVGHDLDRLLGTTWHDDASRQQVTDALLQHGSWDGELGHRRADGCQVTILSRKALQRDVDGRPVAVLSINTDVTARRAAEQALQASEKRFRSQFAHSAIGQIIRGADDRIQEVNPAFAVMLGHPADRLLGTRITDYLAPEAHSDRTRALATIITGQADSYRQECQLIRADGSRLDVHVTVSAIRNDPGHPDRFVSIFQDISDRKTAEQARDAAIADLADRNSELQAANHLKQDLIGMLGHEIGNPLSSILGYTELINDGWDQMPAARQRTMLGAIDRNAHLLDGIVREVLAMVTLDAGKLTATPETVSVRDHLDAALAARGADNVPIDCPAGLTTYVQPGHLGQILTNLLSNATKYGGGATALTATLPDDGLVRIAVRDAGPGVPEKLRPNLFDRFTRAENTAGTVKGTGLGLYIVRELARANDGDVHHEPAPGGGSVFVITLPAECLVPAASTFAG